jgi:hypothetical protein
VGGIEEVVNWVEIDRLAKAHHQIDPTSSEEALGRRLRLWFCIKYNRPFKDPILDTYSIDELAYEYLTWFYLNPDNDPLEKKRKESQSKDDETWVLEQLKKSQKKVDPPKPPEPTPPAAPPIPDLPEISTSFDQ